MGLQVGSGDVGDDDSISPEEDIRSLSVVGKVLDVDCLLINDEDVSCDSVGCVLECSKVERFRLSLAVSDHTHGHQHHQSRQLSFADLDMEDVEVKHVGQVNNLTTTTHHLCSVLQQIPNVVDSDSKDDDSVGASWQVVG